MAAPAGKDLFAEESQLLQEARLTLARIDMPASEWQEHYKKMVEEYERLLGEARTLTRIADRNQRRLDEMNAELERQNQLLREREEEAKKTQQAIIHNFQRISAEQNVMDKRVGRIQIALVVMIAVLTVVILFMLYYLIFDPYRAIELMEELKKRS
ncbi:MAG: DUF3450 domain-containing protein [Bacteroidia bacterium]|nr:DUF3450 domain-containing protein [Bacteroidia bacterium]MDW8236035.1 hypothetical protein [Bacteroidia bacterium]